MDIKEIFNKILEKIEPFDFREEAQKEFPGKGLHDKYIIAVIVKKIFNALEEFNISFKDDMKGVYYFDKSNWVLIDWLHFRDFFVNLCKKIGVPYWKYKELSFQCNFYIEFRKYITHGSR